VVKARTSAAELVESGHVRVNGVRETSPGHAIKAGDVLTIALDRTVRVLKVIAFNERRGVTSFMTLLAVLDVLLQRWSGLDDIVVGSPVVTRQQPETHPLIGFFINTAVLRTHEESAFAGGHIASLSIPWGFAKGDEDLGGYHLVWPRDLVETAGGLLAAGAKSEARRIMRYLQAIQEPDGHWPQNCWLDGTPYWNGVQMDSALSPSCSPTSCGAKSTCPKPSCADSGRW